MRFPASVLSLWLLTAPASLAAYVQSRVCLHQLHLHHRDHDHDRDSHGLSFGSFGLQASLTPGPGDRGIDRFELTFSGQVLGVSACEQATLSNVTSSVRITSLGSSSTFAGRLESADCTDAGAQSKQVRLGFTYQVPPSHFLDTYWLTAELLDESGRVCLNAYLTPDVGGAVSQTATWVPVAVFAVVLVAGLGNQFRCPGTDPDPDPDSSGESPPKAARRHREPRRAHLVRIGDCISYLQFIFFAGSLTLTYPGFLRPVVCRTSWSTLMFPAGLVARQSWYDGVQDGIYEVNGTFGGTNGLELTTQVMGGTMTVDTWLNIVTLAGLIFFLILGLMVLTRRLNKAPRFVSEDRDSFLSGPDDDEFTIQAAALAALRLFCSHFLLPLVAWSSYILTYVNVLPLYYTAAASLMVGCLVALVWFAMWRSSPSRMGYLLVDGIRQPKDASQQQPWRQDLYATSVFVFLFLRGVAIGLLQMAGLLQLLVLLVTEMLQMTLFAFSHRQNPLASRAGKTSALKTAALLLQLGFVPGLASFSAQIILGFAVLFIHALVLFFVFCCPGLYDLYILLTRSSSAGSMQGGDDGRHNDADQAPVYTLRQIMRRPTRMSIPEPTWHHVSMYAQSPSSSPVVSLPDLASRDSSDSSKVSYFRSPRHKSPIDQVSRPRHSGPSFCSSLTDDSASASGSTSADSHVADHLRSSSEHSLVAVRLDPPVDYSFREADLYYHQPRIKTFGEERGEEAQAQAQAQGQTLKSSLRRMMDPFARK
ncbi:hypothetical protein E4U42_005606 [Claviceps africana]|uniref:TRP C-terminal domain-containing protein n=1 Tax=Claviceps africana TaxID=83212 RepID=A0A8K0NJX3_9HYPO|nr:hypothetical protein E4U42_005606 [Claviceps africana]